MKCFIIIPAYNESGRVGPVVRSLREVSSSLDLDIFVVVVDDHSKDTTAAEASAAGAMVLRHIINRDQGAGLITGNQYAMDNGADVIVHFDADGQHSAQSIKRLTDPIVHDGVDMVLGSRFLKEKVVNKNPHQSLVVGIMQNVVQLFKTPTIPFFRRVLIAGNLIVNSLITGTTLSDAHNGSRAFSRNGLAQLTLVQSGKAHATEYVQELKRLKLTYAEVPVKISYNQKEKRSQNIFDATRILKEIFLGKIVD